MNKTDLQYWVTQFQEVENDPKQLKNLKINFQRNFEKINADDDEKEELAENIGIALNNLTKAQKQQTKVVAPEGTEQVIDYDYGKYILNFPSWETLNTENLPYPVFLRDFILPNFHPLPKPELQYPILATLMLINPIALPPLGENCGKEVALPLVYIQGISGSGKTQLTHRFETHYPSYAIATVKGDTPGGGLIEEFHKACYVGENELTGMPILRPSLGVLENFYIRNIDRWGSFYVTLLAIERKDAKSRRGGTEGQVFYAWLLRIFNSINPLEASSEKASELLRRCFRIYCEKGVPKYSAGSFSWRTVRDEYLNLWNKEGTENVFYPILSKVMSMPDDSTDIPAKYFSVSQLVIAVGVYAGIYEDIDDACQQIAAYWEWIESRSDNGGDMVLKILNDWIYEKYEYLVELKAQRGIPKEEVDKEIRWKMPEIMQHIARISGGLYSANDKKVGDQVKEILANNGFKLVTEHNGLVFRKAEQV